MRRIYIEKDKARGISKTFLWLVSEVGEFADSLIKNDRKGLEDEVADILAWLCSECNLLGIDLGRVALEKYGSGCPRCHSIPCNCE
ncbi:MAG: MazG nucleotide pyrophosphohydrolase domain-containing protein [Halobacteria archaeon]